MQTLRKHRIALLIAAVIAILALVPLTQSDSLHAQSGNQWQANFYNNPNWSGAPVYTQYANFISFNWGEGSPASNVPVDNFTGRFTTTAFFYAGTYRFSILTDDEFTLIVDGVTYASTVGKGQSGKTILVDIPMTQGNHTVQVDYRELILSAYAYVNWALDKGSTPIPGATPTPAPTGTPPPYPVPPASASSVTTEFGDYTSCIQNGSHQSNCFQSNGAWNSPNLGSIQSEPQITIWGNCQPADSDSTWVTDANVDPPKVETYRCSKTLAGWFKS